MSTASSLGWFVVYSGIPEIQGTSSCLWRFNPLLLRLLGEFSRSPLWICPLKPEPQLPALTHPGGWADKLLRLVSAGRHQSSVQESLCFALCIPIAALWSFPPVTLHLRQWRDFLVCGIFCSFTAPSQRCKVLSLFFCLFFLLFSFALPRYVGSFLPFGKS